jgi:hypothetical protein
VVGRVNIELGEGDWSIIAGKWGSSVWNFGLRRVGFAFSVGGVVVMVIVVDVGGGVTIAVGSATLISFETGVGIESSLTTATVGGAIISFSLVVVAVVVVTLPAEFLSVLSLPILLFPLITRPSTLLILALCP